MDGKFPMSIVYDMKLKKPGCALLQAAYGASIGSFELQKFDADNWLLAPTPDTKLYSLGTKEELEMAIKVTLETNTKKDGEK